ARWQAFKRDLRVFGPRINHWDALLVDHGYNDPPPRALALHVLVRWVPASAAALGVLTSLDYALMAIAFWAVRRAFGGLAASLAFAFLALSFFARFDFIGGSPLRWDWTAALLIGAVGLGSLLVFHATPWIERPDGTVFVAHDAALAARPAPWVLPAAGALYFLLALPLMLRVRPLESIMYAVPLVFVALSPAGYYYSFLVLLVLLAWRDGAADPLRLDAI